MPKFTTISLTEAKVKTMPSARAKIIAEYVGYIEQAEREGSAGVIESSSGENPRTLRRRLGDAMRQTGKALEIRKDGDRLIFWSKVQKRRPGRPRKS